MLFFFFFNTTEVLIYTDSDVNISPRLVKGGDPETGLCSLPAATFSECTAFSHPLYSHPLHLLCCDPPHLEFPCLACSSPQAFTSLKSLFYLLLFIEDFLDYIKMQSILNFLVLFPTLYPLSHWSLWHCAFHLSFSPLWGQGLTSVFSTTVSSASIKASYA